MNLPPQIKRLTVTLIADEPNLARSHEDIPRTVVLHGEQAFAALRYFGRSPPDDTAQEQIYELRSLGVLPLHLCWSVLVTDAELHDSETAERGDA